VRGLGQQHLSGVGGVHHALRVVDGVAGDIRPTVDVRDDLNRAGVHANPQRDSLLERPKLQAYDEAEQRVPRLGASVLLEERHRHIVARG
jgi:hypothetical protein